MLRSLYSGVSGLKSHQTRMDVIGNNIANVNTIGFKKGRVNFYDTLYQSMKGSTAPTASRGGVNGQAVGLGAAIASVDTITTTGGTQTTNKMSDLMIKGNGYFIIKGDSVDKYYTRAGNFDFDSTGRFVNSSNGMQVMGYMFDPATNDFNNMLQTINISGVKTLNPGATTGLLMEGNLNASKLPADNAHIAPQTVYDSLGRQHILTFSLDKADGVGPQAPTAMVVNDAANTVGWTNTAGFANFTDYEFSLDGGASWTTCAANPQTVPADQDYAIGKVQVRIKADIANNRAAGTPLVSTAAFTASAGGAAAPASLTLNDTTNDVDWTNVGAYAAFGQYEYSTDSGRTWTTCTAKPQNLGDVNIAAGALRVRVTAAATGAAAGSSALSSAALTSTVAPAAAATATNLWRMDISLDGAAITPTGGTIYAKFDTNGQFQSITQTGAIGATATTTFALTGLNYGPPANPGTIALDFTGLTQYAQDSTAWAGTVDATNPEALGYPGGSLNSYTIDQSGIITGIYSNGVTRQLAQLGSATFENAAGLNQTGSNLFQVTNNSGAANEGKVGTGDRGEVSPGTLEMSNVDLSEEFTNMIVTQRGFQANSRIITTSDQMLEEVLSLKR